MTPEEINRVIDQIQAQRAQNNIYWMEAWRLLFKVAPNEARDIQRKIREGDMKISELNARLAGI